jgi:hypothetical protein
MSNDFDFSESPPIRFPMKWPVVQATNEDQQRDAERMLMAAVELGYRFCESGLNLQAALEKATRIIGQPALPGVTATRSALQCESPSVH